MCYHSGYHHNIYETLIKIKHDRGMVGKNCPDSRNGFDSFLQLASPVQRGTWERLGYM